MCPFSSTFRSLRIAALLLALAPPAHGQGPLGTETSSGAKNSASTPIAIVAVDSSDNKESASVTGALEVGGGRASITTSGTITAGTRTTEVLLPRRGSLLVCASTSVKLAADSSVPAGEIPGLLMAIDRGALEMSFATVQNADTLLTPDFRIVIAGPGSSEVKVRLGQDGDTCVDNPGANAPYVVVSSIFDGGVYRVQPGQRVMFERGSLQSVVDQEKEPCGCPPEASETKGNEFPLAQSMGLAPTPAPADSAKLTPPADALVYKSADHAPQTVELPKPAPAQAPATSNGASKAKPKPAAGKPGFFHKLGRFFRRVFGAES